MLKIPQQACYSTKRTLAHSALRWKWGMVSGEVEESV